MYIKYITDKDIVSQNRGDNMENLNLTYKVQIVGLDKVTRFLTISHAELIKLQEKKVNLTILKTSRLD